MKLIMHFNVVVVVVAFALWMAHHLNPRIEAG
jgi:hypothetical protein